MSRDREFMTDILEAARLAISYVKGKTLEEFLTDVECQDAVIRRLEIIGEAARRISDETQSRLPELPWSSMTGMRNVLIHEYDGVDLMVVWDAVMSNLPPLVCQVERALASDG